MRARSFWHGKGLPLPFPTFKGLMAPTLVSCLGRHYIQIQFGVKLFLGLDYVGNLGRIRLEIGFLQDEPAVFREG